MLHGEARPLVLVVSDSLGDTAFAVLRAALAQFKHGSCEVRRLAKINDVELLRAVLDESSSRSVVVLHTIVDVTLRRKVEGLLDSRCIPIIDVIGPALDALSMVLRQSPSQRVGAVHQTDVRYFERIQAMEYFVAHDDGRNCNDLSDADLVLIGVSRTSKTPLSMYLAYLGYKVANIPLALGIEPPAALFDVDPARVFGLVSTVEEIAQIRSSRLGDEVSRSVAGRYADPSIIFEEQRAARALMGRIGCIVIKTDRKAIEESAAEIIGHLDYVLSQRSARERGSAK